MRMGLRGMKAIDRQYDTSYGETEEPGKKMKAIEGNMIQAMARLKNPANESAQAGFEPRTSGLKVLKLAV